MPRISIENMRNLLKLYFIAGSINCKHHPAQVLKEAIDGGITLFQFREKGKQALTGTKKYELAKELQSICRENGIPFIVNDDIELALALDADGIHIGQDDESAQVVRQKIGDKILGVSAHNLAEAEEAIRHGADYIGMGPVFPTATKEDAKAVQGTKFIQEVREQGIPIPIVGIGGISSQNASSVVRGGADGVAVITAISMADSVYSSAMELRKAVDQ